MKKIEQYKSQAICKKNLLPINDALDILRGKWKIRILKSLIFGDKRFKELQRDIGKITPKMLSKELRDLEINKLVIRTVYDTSPPKVEYSITPHGKSLGNVIVELANWGLEAP